MENVKNHKIVDWLMFYVFNKWCEEESKLIFGANLGKHIFDKWCWYRENGGDQLEWYANLDESCRDKLVERAVEHYTKPSNG